MKGSFLGTFVIKNWHCWIQAHKGKQVIARI